MKKYYSKVNIYLILFPLVKKVKEFDANEKYLAVKKLKNEIEIYEIPKNIDKGSLDPKEYGILVCIINPSCVIKEFHLNPKYMNILLVVNYKKILFFVIPEKSQEKVIVSPKLTFNKIDIGFESAIFNPFNSHIIASSCLGNTIQIWSVSMPFIQKIFSSDIPSKMKWRNCGKLLGFVDKDYLLKIYDIKKKEFIFYLDFVEAIENYEFFDNNKILVNSEEKMIFEYKFAINDNEDLKMIKKDNYQNTFKIEFNHFLSCKGYFILNTNEGIIKLFQNFTKPIYNHKCSLSEPKIIKSSDEKIISKIIDIDEDNNVRLIILSKRHKDEEKKEFIDNEIKEENISDLEIDLMDNSPEDLSEDYFKNCPTIFLDVIENLNFKYNEDVNKYKKKKNYLNMDEIEKSLEKNKNVDLISLRKDVKMEIEKLNKKEKENENKIPKEKLFNSTKEEYLFYLHLLIKDETNPDLLLKYLFFLRDNKNKLDEENLPYEIFEEELEYYSVFFEKNKLHELFGYTFESEKTKLIHLLEDYSKSIKNNTFQDYKKKLKDKYKRRYFNQPISFECQELIYYDCNKILYGDIFKDKNKDEEKLKAKLYIMEEIKRRKILENFKDPEVIIPIISFICLPEQKENVDFFLNMIESKTLTNEELKEKSIIYQNDYNNINKFFDNESLIQLKELCFENLNNNNYKSCEKYNFKYLIKNPPLKLYFDKIKNLLSVVFKSKVFKEAYLFLTGNNNYEAIFSEEMISEYINSIKFLPINFSDKVAFLDRLSLMTIIPTMKKEINSNFVKYKNEISLILENGVIVAIIFNEFGHAINTVISFLENKLKLTETPRKKYLKFKEGAYYMEIALFGRVIKTLSYGEALYILNEDNYKKSLNDFRKGFMELPVNMVIKGPFSDFNLNNINDIDEIKTTISIKAKRDDVDDNDDEKDVLNHIKISIPLRNDLIDRDIKEEDLEPYF